MRIFYSTFISLMVLFGLNACQKNIDLFVPDPVQIFADTVWQNNLPSNASVVSLKTDLLVQHVTDSFSYSNTGIVFSSGNLSLNIPASGLVKNNGTVPTGIIKRESLLIQKRGDFIAMNMPTTVNGKLLITGGAFFMDLKNDNTNLKVSAGNKITVRYNSLTPVLNNHIYNAVLDSITGLFERWELNSDTAFNKSLTTGNGYEIQTNKLQYVQTAHVLDTVGISQTFVSLKLPANYTNTNTLAYISFNDLECVAALNANVSTHTFISPSLPINRSATIIVISKQAGDYYFGTQQITITGSVLGGINQTVLFSPVKKSLTFVKTYLSNL